MIQSGFPYSSKMNEVGLSWLINLLVALSIFFTAELGRYFGLHQLALAISVVWPPTGISLAAMLLFGFKAWPGIFLGNFVNNAYHLLLGNFELAPPVLTALAIAAGSVAQAFLATYVIQHFSSSRYFMKVKDMLIFLIPAGMITCMLSSTVGVVSLYLYGTVSEANFLYAWMTFWLGDSLGVYLFTPLIVSWSLPRTSNHHLSYYWEAAFITLGILTVGYATFVWNYPLLHLFIPLSISATYRFYMRGAATSIFLIAWLVIIPTSLGLGVLNLLPLPLLVLVSFLEVMVFVCLNLAAVLEEREVAWKLLQSHNIDLQEALEMNTEEIARMRGNMLLKDKQAAMGLFSLGISKRMQSPLNSISTLIGDAIGSLDELRTLLQSQGPTLPEDVNKGFVASFQRLEERLRDIAKNQALARRIAQVVQDQSNRVNSGSLTVQSVNLHTLLDMCLTKVFSTASKRFSNFICSVNPDYDSSIQMLPALPEDLAYAFIHLFDNAAHSMYQKKIIIGSAYEPAITIQTLNHYDKIEIVIRDNGLGVSSERLPHFLQTFTGDEFPEEAAGLGVAIAHDIIVHVHHGEINVESSEGEFLQLTISLPKPLGEK
jgi:two-component system NtrC family sensor kinase